MASIVDVLGAGLARVRVHMEAPAPARAAEAARATLEAARRAGLPEDSLLVCVSAAYRAAALVQLAVSEHMAATVRPSHAGELNADADFQAGWDLLTGVIDTLTRRAGVLQAPRQHRRAPPWPSSAAARRLQLHRPPRQPRSRTRQDLRAPQAWPLGCA